LGGRVAGRVWKAISGGNLAASGVEGQGELADAAGKFWRRDTD